MLKVMKIKSSNGVEKYLTEGKEHYYSQGHEEKGIWVGGESFGYSGEVQAGDLKNILEGRNKEGVLQGQVLEKRRVGWDCTFSAPKSVSIVWAFSDEEEKKNICEAHDKAVLKALDYLKTSALDNAVRRGKGGLIKEPVKEIPMAIYKHFTSRENDMQIHSHVILPNLARRHDGSVGGMQPDQVFKRMQEIGAIYQAELGNNLKKLGYAVENDKNSIKMSNIPIEMENLFSKRSQIISEKIQLENAVTGKHKDSIKKLSRKNKTHTNPIDVHNNWKNEFDLNGYKIEQIRSLKQKDKDFSIELDEDKKVKLKQEIIDKFVKNMSSTQSTFHENDLRREIAKLGRAYFGADEIIELMDQAKASYHVLELGHKIYTTQEIFDIEKSMNEKISLFNGMPTHSCSTESIHKALTNVDGDKILSQEQVNMVKHIVNEGNIKVVEGLPGTGKSFALARACDVFKENGYEVRGLAPTGKAAENLGDLNISSITVDKFLYDLEKGRDQFQSNSVILIDEAAMLGSKKTSKLIDHMYGTGAKIILVGDSKQLQPLDAGGAFRMIKNKVGYVELKDIRRQNYEWQREAILDLRNGDTEKALKSYLSHNAIKVSENQENMIQNITNKYISDRKEFKNQSQLILCGTNYQVEKINDSIREELKKEKALDSKNSFEIEVKNRNNEKSFKEFCVHDRIYFLQNSSKIDVKNGSLGEIKKITKNSKNEVILDVKLDNNKKIKVNTKEYNKIDHGYSCTVHKSQGSTVDRVQIALDRMDNEMAGVALSRHRENAIIYTNKENHGDLINSYEEKNQKTESLSKDFQIAIESMNQSIRKSNQKTTTIENHNKEFVTEWHLNKSKELLLTKEPLRQFEILKEMSVKNLGVENPFLEPSIEVSRVHKEAAAIIERGKFQKSEIENFCSMIKEMPFGEKCILESSQNDELKRNKIFEKVFEKTENKLSPKIEKVREVEKEISRNRFSRSHSREREGRELSIERGFGMGR